MRDQHGNETSTRSPQNLAVFERALRAFNTYRGDAVAIVDEALADDPDFAMGQILRGHVLVSMWEKSVVPGVLACAEKLAAMHERLTDRERGHARVLVQWACGDWDGARQTLDRLTAEYPRDLLALQIGHLYDFYHGDRDNLRGRIARALPAWTRNDPGYAFLLGMYAFGLEESGNLPQAEETGRHALALEAEDSWAHHAVTHVLEMQARQAEGIAFMRDRQVHWAQPDNGFQFHNWWHKALFHLDQDDIEPVLAIYDAGVRPEPVTVQLMLVDATALLWRLHLRGIDVGKRWDELAEIYANDGEGGFYAFNDMHALLACLATGRQQALESRIAAMERASGENGTNGRMTREVGMQIARGLAAFARKDYGKAVEELMPVRYRACVFGGSHAQRDILQRTLLEAAIRGADYPLATALANERVVLKPHCPYNRELLQRATTARSHDARVAA